MTPQDAEQVIVSVLGTTAVLVGGQAVSWWAAYYQLGTLSEVFVSSDVDFVGGRDEARLCATRLNGRLQVQGAPFDSIPVSAAAVLFTDSQGETRKVDFLLTLCGIDKTSDIQKHAVRFELNEQPFFVMNPVASLRTRLANICHLGRTDNKSCAQARLSIRACKSWLVDPNAHEGKRAALRWVEDVFRFARSHDHAKKASITYGIEAFEAIEPNSWLGDMFVRERYPRMRAQIEADRARRRSQLRGASTS